MSLSDIFSDAIKYPFSDLTKFAIVGILALLASLTSVVGNFNINNIAITLIVALVSFIFIFVLSGYGISVIKNGIEISDEIPDVDLKKNFIDGIKSLIIGIVYMIIPIIIVFLLSMFTGAIGSGLNHLGAAILITAVISIILFLAFALLELVALARFAESGEMGDAFSFGEVFEDVKKIGIPKIIGFLIIAIIIMIIIGMVISLLGYIPYAGFIIVQFILGAFLALFYHRGIGLLYSDVY